MDTRRIVCSTSGQSPRLPTQRRRQTRRKSQPITRQTQLAWEDSQDNAAVSGQRLKREEKLELGYIQEPELASVVYSDICNGVAWYKISVYKSKETQVARQLAEEIRELPPIEESENRRGKKRYVSTWIPKKRVIVVSDKKKKGVRRMIKYGPLKGEVLFVACQMDAIVYSVIKKQRYVKSFVHKHPLNDSVPLPCPPAELHEVFDWLWKDEKIIGGEEPQIKHMNPVDVDDDDADADEADLAFEVDRIPSVRDRLLGKEVELDEEDIACEYGPGWQQKQKRIFREQRYEERQARNKKEDRTDNRVTRGRWRGTNPALERQREIERDDYKITTWYDGSADTDMILDDHQNLSKTRRKSRDVKVDSSKNRYKKETSEDVFLPRADSENVAPAVGREVLVTSGPYAELSGTILQMQNRRALVKVDVFGKSTDVFFAFDEIRVLE